VLQLQKQQRRWPTGQSVSASQTIYGAVYDPALANRSHICRQHKKKHLCSVYKKLRPCSRPGHSVLRGRAFRFATEFKQCMRKKSHAPEHSTPAKKSPEIPTWPRAHAIQAKKSCFFFHLEVDVPRTSRPERPRDAISPEAAVPEKTSGNEMAGRPAETTTPSAGPSRHAPELSISAPRPNATRPTAWAVIRRPAKLLFQADRTPRPAISRGSPKRTVDSMGSNPNDAVANRRLKKRIKQKNRERLPAFSTGPCLVTRG